MKHIVYLGSAFTGKSENLRSLQRLSGAPLTTSRSRGGEGRILSLEARSAHGPVRLSTVPGFVFRDAGRMELVATADAIVFVADGRPARFLQTLEAWDALPEYTKGLKALPVVLQYNFRDAPDATPIATLEEGLGVQPLLLAGERRIANPTARLYPHRIQSVAVRDLGVRETFEAAAQAAYFGFAAPDRAPAPPAARSVDELAEEMMALAEATILHDVTCPSCRHVQARFEVAFQEPGAEGPFRVGDALPVDFARVDPELYLPVQPHQGGPLFVLDAQRCPRCEAICWLGVVLEDGRLAAVWPVTLTRAAIERCHYATSGLAFEAARLVGLTVDDVLPQESLPILRQHLAPS